MKTVYYRSLVRWEIVDEIVFLTDPLEQSEARELILKTLDHAVLEAVLDVLPREHHETFLERLEREYHEEQLLNWLEEHHAQIRDHLRIVIQRTKSEIREVISVEQEV